MGGAAKLAGQGSVMVDGSAAPPAANVSAAQTVRLPQWVAAVARGAVWLDQWVVAVVACQQIR